MTRTLVLLTTSKVAGTFGVAQATVRRWCIAYQADPTRGIRNVILPSGVYRIPQDAVDEILASGRTPEDEPGPAATDADTAAVA